MTLFERIREAIEKRLAHHAANKTDIDAHDMAQHVNEVVETYAVPMPTPPVNPPSDEPEQPAKTEEGA